MLESYEIKPYSEVATIPNDRTEKKFPLDMVLPVLGMSEYFVKKVIGKHDFLTEQMVVELLEQDAFSETFVPKLSFHTVNNSSRIGVFDILLSKQPNRKLKNRNVYSLSILFCEAGLINS